MELIKNITNTSLEEIILENNLSIIKDNDFKNLYLLKYKKEKSDFNSLLVKECRGIILEDKSNKIICYGLDKMDSKIKFEEIANNIWSECRFEDAIDGTQIRLYYYNKWNVTTARCIDGYKSKWNYIKSYGTLFDDLIHLIDFTKLNKNNTYTFIMRHIENRIIEKVDKNELYHIHTRDNISLKELEEDINIKKPSKYIFESFEDLQNELDVMTYNSMGYVISYKNKKYLYRCKDYENVKDLKGNNFNVDYNYLELKDNNKLDTFINYFPEYKILFKYTENKLSNLYEIIHTFYLNKFIHKTLDFKDININYRTIIYKLHGLFILSKEPTTIKIVEQYINTLKVGHIINLLKYIKIKNIIKL